MNRSPPPVTTSYFGLTRAPRYSLTFALPLLLAYEVLAVAINQGAGSGIRNGADVLLRSLAATVFGDRGPALFGALVARQELKSHFDRQFEIEVGNFSPAQFAGRVQ